MEGEVLSTGLPAKPHLSSFDGDIAAPPPGREQGASSASPGREGHVSTWWLCPNTPASLSLRARGLGKGVFLSCSAAPREVNVQLGGEKGPRAFGRQTAASAEHLDDVRVPSAPIPWPVRPCSPRTWMGASSLLRLPGASRKRGLPRTELAEE